MPLITRAPLPTGPRLQSAREAAGLTADAAAASTGLALQELRALEAGRRALSEQALGPLLGVYGDPAASAFPSRQPVCIDLDRRLVVVGERSLEVADPRDPDAVYPVYLDLVRAARGARVGQRLHLRPSDVAVLTEVLGEDPDTVERRLVALMGCTREQASVLRRALARPRALSGALAALSLAGLLVVAPDVQALWSPAPAALVGVAPAAVTAGARADRAPEAAPVAVDVPVVDVPVVDVPVVDVPVVDVPVVDVPVVDVPVVDVPVDVTDVPVEAPVASAPGPVDLSDDIVLDAPADAHADTPVPAAAVPAAAVPTGVDLSDDLWVDAAPEEQPSGGEPLAPALD